ncbi:MAG: L,D-transpeptidase, partial [Solirubrobacteraceae bacterium]
PGVAGAGAGPRVQVRVMLLFVARSLAFPVLAAQASGGSAAAAQAGDEAPDRVLSDERRDSRWAYVEETVLARARPNDRAAPVRRLTPWTGDDTPELVLLLEERTDARDRTWVRVRLPMRPANRTGWVRRARLGKDNRVATKLVVDRRALRATLYRDGRTVWTSPVGIGKPGWPTPPGRFYIRERLVPSDPTGIYGVLAFGTSAYAPYATDWPGGGVVGVHGTNQPELIPGRPSHGCIRVPNSRIRRLGQLMTLGTPLQIR